MPFARLSLLAAALACLAVPDFAAAAHRIVLQGNDRLVILKPDGAIEWETKWGGIHDIWVLKNGNLLVPEGAQRIVELDIKTRKVVWSYDSGKQNGNAGKKVELHAFQPLEDDRIMIAESGPGRIIEIDRAGKLLKEIRLNINKPHPHTDTRLARKLANNNYLVCHEGDGTVREYDGVTGDVVWEFEIPLFGKQRKNGHGPEAFGNKTFAAVRLANGNTLIATGNGHSVLEVTREHQIVWKIEQHDLPGITLAWVTTIEVLPNGRYLIGNCHAGPGNPLLIEIEPATKKVIWTLDRFGDFGNSVSSSQVMDVEGPVLR